MCVKTKSRRCETCRWPRVLTAMRLMRRCGGVLKARCTKSGWRWQRVLKRAKRLLCRSARWAEIWIGRLNRPNTTYLG